MGKQLVLGVNRWVHTEPYFTPENEKDTTAPLPISWRLDDGLDDGMDALSIEVQCLCGAHRETNFFLDEEELSEWGQNSSGETEPKRMARAVANRLVSFLQHLDTCTAKLEYVTDCASPRPEK